MSPSDAQDVAPDLDGTAALATAKARWPAIRVSASVLAKSLMATGVSAANLTARPEEVVLAHAASLGDAAAIMGFEESYLPGATAAIRRYTRDNQRTDDVVQQLRIHMLVGADGAVPRLARFDGRAPLGAWVAMCASRLALHALRSERNNREIATEWSDALAEMPTGDPAIESLREQYGELVATALRDACMELPRRHRAVVRLLFVDDASVDEVAAMYQVHRVTVWRWIQEARATLAEQVRIRLTDAAANEDIGASVLVGWALDQVELSLDGALSPTQTDLHLGE